MVVWCLLTFVPIRLVLGGGNYLPSRAWYLLCFIIPVFVLVGLLTSAFCVPLHADWATAGHLVFAIFYMQIDLCVARLLCGQAFGTWSLPALVAGKFSFLPQAANGDGMTPPGVPPLGRSAFELNGALFHEIFWNVFICQNCLRRGLPLVLALLAVPAVSCLVHAITSNVNTGLRCLPNFVWVALSYHASGSVLVPALVHGMWYFLDAKLCFALKTLKREWDIHDRADEKATPSWDTTCSVGLLLVLVFYVPLNVLTSMNPGLTSVAGLQRMEACSTQLHVEMPKQAIEQALACLIVVQLLVGAATWGTVRAGMDVLERSGDLSENGVKTVVDAVRDYNRDFGLFSFGEGAGGCKLTGRGDDHEGSVA
eukprot:TRINITY_DN52064_c0_g1_i1.p1 TRINITY_DN52064_c0_g1~~TRINITY_DN52064_c0_g1_i1.p1  ORF type:complete len:407 (+),score=56.89 TRINITY_DN52064_c0_g1_i1:119-1222(+)